jgi:hypothetical protein
VAVDEIEMTTLDEATITRLGDILTELGRGQHANAFVGPNVKHQSAEFLTSYIKHGYSLHDLLLPEIDDVNGTEYTHDITETERSIRENRFYPSKYWGRQIFQDYRCSNGGNVLLHNDQRKKEVVRKILDYVNRSPEKIVPAMHHALNDRFEMIKKERTEYLQDVYSSPDALAFVGKKYSIEEGARILDTAFGATQQFLDRMEIAYGMDATRKFVAENYTAHDLTHNFMQAQQFTQLIAAYPIKQAAQALRKEIESTPEFIRTLENTFGLEATLQYARDRYDTPTRVGKVLFATYASDTSDIHGPARAFEYTRMAFADRIPASIAAEERSVEASTSTGAAYRPAVAMQKQS